MAERIQALIHKLEVDAGARWLNYAALVLVVGGFAVWYDTHCYHNFDSPEAMDTAQVARNLAEGHGFTTQFIRPFNIYLLEKHHHALGPAGLAGTQAADAAELNGRQPDLANAPVYPLLLAGLFKLAHPQWNVELHKPFWSAGGHFMRYRPEFLIALFNQVLLLGAVLLTFLVTRTILDLSAAWLAAVLVLFSNQLWQYSVSGLPLLLLLVIFLGVVWCLAAFELARQQENPNLRRLFTLAMVAGCLTGLGMLTRYSFGWLIIPIVVFLISFGGPRRAGLAVAAVLVFLGVVSPWLMRNVAVSGTLFGSAGYAVMEVTFPFPGTHLMQSLTPDLNSAFALKPYLVKLLEGLRDLLQNDILRLGGGWISILFLAGLLLRLRHPPARHLRYFTVGCLVLFVVVGALGRTSFNVIAPGNNTENLLALLTPMVNVFGVAFFLTLLDQMELPVLPVRQAVIGFMAFLLCLPMVLTLLPPKMSTTIYPPYYPPEIQRFATWIHPDELMMSDLPWAVAWYGDRQCVWTTLNSGYEFSQLNDYVKHVSALYLTHDTLDSRLFSQCLQGASDSWSSFIFERVAVNKIRNPADAADTWAVTFRSNPQNARENFPLNSAPLDIYSGLFLADRPRWLNP